MPELLFIEKHPAVGQVVCGSSCSHRYLNKQIHFYRKITIEFDRISKCEPRQDFIFRISNSGLRTCWTVRHIWRSISLKTRDVHLADGRLEWVSHMWGRWFLFRLFNFLARLSLLTEHDAAWWTGPWNWVIECEARMCRKRRRNRWNAQRFHSGAVQAQ